MTKAIFYKEWIKTRWYFLAMLITSLGFTAYALMRMQRVVTFKGADHIWAIMLTREKTFIEPISYLPLICGLLLAIVQFVPEMVQKRLKLTLHLPYSQKKMILMMLLAGFVQLIIIFLLQTVMISGFALEIVPSELLERMLLTAAPWFISGLSAYLFTAAICLEPAWKMRIVNILLMAGVLRIFFLSDTPEAYNSMLVVFIVLMILYFTLAYRSVFRFKEGCQD